MSIYNSAASPRDIPASASTSLDVNAPSAKTDTSSVGAVSSNGDLPKVGSNPKEDWNQSLQQATSLKNENSDEILEEKHQRTDIEVLADKLRYQIERMRSQHAGLKQIAGEAESVQLRHITSLMSMIASLSRSLNTSQSKDLPDYRQVSSFMRSLEARLSSQRQQQSSDKSRAENSLFLMQNEQAALERELAMIHQQLSALHSRLISLGAL